MDALKLVALDKDDIEVVSAHLQDSEVKAADIRWRPQENRLVIALNRFDWEAAHGAKEFRRRQALLRFDRVSSCVCKNCSNCEEGKKQLLNLLAVSFQETDQPAGIVTLHFEGGAALRLEVECLEAELADFGPSWTVAGPPAHVIDGEAIGTSKQG